jgi:hypothetical protein
MHNTITVSQLSSLIDLTIEHFHYLRTLPSGWFPQLDAEQIGTPEIHNYQQLTEQILWWTWEFTQRWRDTHGYSTHPQPQEVDLVFIAALGAEVKKLGFQLQ